MFSIGGILGALMGAFFTEYIHPKWGMMLYSFFPLSMAIGAYRMHETKVKMECGKIAHAAKTYQITKKAMSTPIIYKILLFHFLSGAIIPRFTEFKYYFLIDNLKFT